MKEVIPEITFDAVIANITSASAFAASALSELRVDIAIMNGIALIMKLDNIVPNFGNEGINPPPINAIIPLTNSATVNAIIAADRYPTDANVD